LFGSGFLLGAEARTRTTFLASKKRKRNKNTNKNTINSDKDSDKDSESLLLLLDELDSFVRDAISYLVRISHTHAQDAAFPGRFTYLTDLRHKLDPTLRDSFWNLPNNHQSDYNLLRHNGAIYALSQAYARNQERLAARFGGATALAKVDQKLELEKLQTDIRTTMERAISYLRDNALLPVPNHGDWLAAWERTELNDPHSEPNTAKLGGAGLAMIALGKMESMAPNSVSLERELRKMGAFVESLQDANDGSFSCKYEWTTGPNSEWTSLYYPGEAALGLVTLAELELELEEGGNGKAGTTTSTDMEHEHQRLQNPGSSSGADAAPEQHSRRWIRVATKALLYLEKLRRDQSLDEIEPDHWALLATAKLLPILDRQRKALDGNEKKKADIEYWLVYNQGLRVATSIVADHTTEGLRQHQGCFTYDYRTCATSTRLEGLLAALTFVQESELFLGGNTEDASRTDKGDATELLRDRIERDVEMGIRFLLKAQQKSDRNNMRGAVPGKYTGKRPVLSTKYNRAGRIAHDDQEGSEDDDEDYYIAEVRVDYVQHSMSAVMAYESYLLNKTQQKRKRFHEKIHEKVHNIADPILHHVRKKIDTATRSSTFVNYAILVAVGFLILVMVGLAYCPASLLPFSRRYPRRPRLHKRED